MATQTLILADCTYECWLCEAVHSFNDSEEFSLHKAFMTGSKRMVYVEVAE